MRGNAWGKTPPYEWIGFSSFLPRDGCSVRMCPRWHCQWVNSISRAKGRLVGIVVGNSALARLWGMSSLDQTFLDFHAEVAAGFLDVGQDFVAGLETRDGGGLALRVHQADGLGVLQDQADRLALGLGFDQ